MPGTRTRQIVHPFELVIFVDDLQSEGATQRGPLPDAGENLDPIGLDSLSPAASIAALSPLELHIDRIGVERDASRKAVDQSEHRFAV